MSSLLDIVSYVATLVVAYYSALFLVSLWTTRRTPGASAADEPFYVLVIPAHDEELVIAETVRRARTLDGDRHVVLVMNDGSADATAARRSPARARGRCSTTPAVWCGDGCGTPTRGCAARAPAR